MLLLWLGYDHDRCTHTVVIRGEKRIVRLVDVGAGYLQ